MLILGCWLNLVVQGDKKITDRLCQKNHCLGYTKKLQVKASVCCPTVLMLLYLPYSATANNNKDHNNNQDGRQCVGRLCVVKHVRTQHQSDLAKFIKFDHIVDCTKNVLKNKIKNYVHNKTSLNFISPFWKIFDSLLTCFIKHPHPLTDVGHTLFSVQFLANQLVILFLFYNFKYYSPFLLFSLPLSCIVCQELFAIY
jgi:hypothetical protein